MVIRNTAGVSGQVVKRLEFVAKRDKRKQNWRRSVDSSANFDVWHTSYRFTAGFFLLQ